MSTTDAEREAHDHQINGQAFDSVRNNSRHKFDALLAALPASMQATIRDSMGRNESNSWSFWRAGFQAGRAQALAELAAMPAVACMGPDGELSSVDRVHWTPLIARPAGKDQP